MTHGETRALREAFEVLSRLAHGMVESGAACDDPEGFVLACETQDGLGALLFYLEGNEETVTAGGTCHDTHEEADCFICSECGGRMAGWTEDGASIRANAPAFCPNCGARVVEAA